MLLNDVFWYNRRCNKKNWILAESVVKQNLMLKSVLSKNPGELISYSNFFFFWYKILRISKKCVLSIQIIIYRGFKQHVNFLTHFATFYTDSKSTRNKILHKYNTNKSKFPRVIPETKAQLDDFILSFVISFFNRV